MALVNFEAFINRYKSEDRAATSSSSSSSSASLPPSPSLAISFFSTGLRKDTHLYTQSQFLVTKKNGRPEKKKQKKSKHQPGNVDQNLAELALLFSSALFFPVLLSPTRDAEHPVAQPDPQVALQKRAHLPQLGPDQRVGDDAAAASAAGP